jgi:tRNA (Thr-GGU) A37 N-methylase
MKWLIRMRAVRAHAVRPNRMGMVPVQMMGVNRAHIMRAHTVRPNRMGMVPVQMVGVNRAHIMRAQTVRPNIWHGRGLLKTCYD